MRRNRFAIALASIAIASISAQEPPARGGSGRGGGRGQQGAQPLVIDDQTGFQPIFDGTSLKGWDGDPAFWKAVDGAIVGESSPDNAVKENTFLIWRGGEPRDFELKVQFRMNSTNSGIQIRSVHLPPGTPSGNSTVQGQWVMKGYQADIDFNNRYTGMIYEERGRGILMQRGQAVYLAPDGTRRIIANLQRDPDELKSFIKPGDWNQIHIIARGNTLMNIVNGELMAVLIDDDAKARALKGLLGLQIHVGPPMKIEFRNMAMKKL